MVSIYLLTNIKTSCHKGNIYLPQHYMYNSTVQGGYIYGTQK